MCDLEDFFRKRGLTRFSGTAPLKPKDGLNGPPASPMKTKTAITFALSGAFAGLLLIVSSTTIPLILLLGVGPVIVGASVFAAVSQGIAVSTPRAVFAVLLSLPAYLISFGAFAETASLVQRHISVPSTSLSELGPDIVSGLVAAVVVAGVLLECLALLLSRRWSTPSLAGLVGGGIGSVAVSYIAKVWYFNVAGLPDTAAQIIILFGPLVILGGGISSMIIGEQMRRSVHL